MKKLRSYGDWRLEKLSDPVRAARYLNAAKKESKEALLYALKNVIQANQVKRVAKEAGISRESVYRSFASSGNPELDTLDGVLDAVNIEYRFFAKGENVRALESDHTKEALVSTGHNHETGQREYCKIREARERRPVSANEFYKTYGKVCHTHIDYIEFAGAYAQSRPPAIAYEQMAEALINLVRMVDGTLQGYGILEKYIAEARKAHAAYEKEKAEGLR